MSARVACFEQRIGRIFARNGRIVEFVAAKHRSGRTERCSVPQPHRPIPQMQFTSRKRGIDRQQVEHRVADAGSVFEAAAERHIAPAFAIDEASETTQSGFETGSCGERSGMQFRIAAGQEHGIGVGRGGLVGKRAEEA